MAVKKIEAGDVLVVGDDLSENEVDAMHGINTAGMTDHQKAEAIAEAKAARKAMLDAMTPENRKAYLAKERADNFVRLSVPRMGRAIAAINSVGKLSAPSYRSTEEQQRKMFAALRKAVDACEAAFAKSKAAESAFSFD